MNPQGLTLSNSQNKTEARHIHNYSTFDKSLSYQFANTLRFGEIMPSFVMEGVERDSISVNSSDRIDSLSLNAPIKSSIRKVKSSFKVPRMAILPLNWDRIYTQPSNGDDVPKLANCILESFPQYMKDFWYNIFYAVKTNFPDNNTATANDIAAFYTAFTRMVILGEYVYSSGSLLHSLGYRISYMFEQTVDGYVGKSYDDFFDRMMKTAFGDVIQIQVSWYEGSNTRSAAFSGLSSNAAGATRYQGSFRDFLDFWREIPTATISLLVFDSFLNTPGAVASYLSNTFLNSSMTNNYFSVPTWTLPVAHPASDDITDVHPSNLDLSRVLAYQLVCAHFFSNSSVDVIYTAELYRQYVRSLTQLVYGSTYVGLLASTFGFNGMSCPFDYLSGFHLMRALYCQRVATPSPTVQNINYSVLSGDGDSSNSNIHRLSVFAAIFGYRRSLRYGDYFVGSRPRPLAPINTDVSVNNNAVSVIDITRNIQAQRFANAVMRSRSKIEEYVESLFGKKPDVDFHNPLYLAEESEIIYGDDVQNTGAAQVQDANSRTALFANNVGRYTFTFENNDMHPCIYLQLITFDVRRSYTRSIDRQMMHEDRFDMFNPDFQYIGDQAVYGMELGEDIGYYIPDVFAYQTRDAEYKQRFDVCSGAFVNNRLPGWLITDESRHATYVGHLDPDFIRNYNGELDKFFLDLSGFALGHYFHFICITNNNVIAKRAMAVDPQILG